MSIVQSALERMKVAQNVQGSARSPKSAAAVNLEFSATAPAQTHISWPASSAPALSIDMSHLRSQGFLPDETFGRRQQEDYRRIRREIVGATRQRPNLESPEIGPIVVVTSALPGEGKSYTALNLALSIASQGTHDVLLIDSDTIRRSLTLALGAGDSAGLIDVLAQPPSERGFMEFARETTIPRLRFMPAGIEYEGARDLFSSSRIGPFCHSIRNAMAGHIVIFDTPPILLSSQTPILTDASGQVVLVVRAGHTLQDSVKEATARIRETVPVGLVLNGWDPVLPSEKQTYRGYEVYE